MLDVAGPHFFAEDEMAIRVRRYAVQIYEIAPFAEDSFVLILEKIELMLWPIVVNTKTAAAPIKTNNNEYSTISCPCSSLINSRIIDFPPGFCMVIGLKHLGCVEVSGDFLIDSAHCNHRNCEGGCETACSFAPTLLPIFPTEELAAIE